MTATQALHAASDAIPALGSTAVLTTRGGPVTGILVRRNARNPALPAMLSIQTTDLSDRSRSERIQVPEGVGHEIAFTPPAPGTVLTLSTDLPVETVYHVDGDEASARAWLETERPIWYRSGDYRLRTV
jgi:hypothetical protein